MKKNNFEIKVELSYYESFSGAETFQNADFLIYKDGIFFRSYYFCETSFKNEADAISYAEQKLLEEQV